MNVVIKSAKYKIMFQIGDVVVIRYLHQDAPSHWLTGMFFLQGCFGTVIRVNRVSKSIEVFVPGQKEGWSFDSQELGLVESSRVTAFYTVRHTEDPPEYRDQVKGEWKESTDDYNCRCPKCGAPAYQGFIKVDCSNKECK